MARRYCDEPEYINPYRSVHSGHDTSPSSAFAVVGILALALCAAAYAVF